MVPVIGIVHQQPGGLDRPWFSRLARQSLDGLTYRRARGVICVSEWLADQLVRRGLDRDRITVVRPGRPALRPESVRPEGQSQVVAVSNWTANKNVHLIIEAFARVEDDRATLHLIGDSQRDPGYTHQVRARIARDDLGQRVIEHGSLAPSEVDPMLMSSHIFVHAARHESYGSAVVEAMAAGLPVIAFGVDNLPYLIRDGREGLLAPFGDIPWLVAALRSLLGDPLGRQAMGRAARERAAGFPTWSESAQRFFVTIRRFLSAAQAESRT